MTSLLIQHLITTTLLASLVWVVCRLAKPAPAARHILWSLVIVKLMIPPMGELNVTVPTLRHISEAKLAVATPRNDSAIPDRQEPRPPARAAAISNWKGEAPAEPTWPMDSVNQISPLETAPAVTTSTTPPTKTTSPTSMNWPILAIAAWLCGAIALAALQLIRWQRFTAQTSASGETPKWLQEEATSIAKRLGCKAVSVVVCNRLSTPAVAGVLKPRILVPSALLERLPRERWRALLTHELAHVKRHDTWWRTLELACGIVWFWNPVFWFARKQARITAEHACDAWVVWAMPDQRRAYADSLVDVSEWASTPTLPATAIGMSAASREKLEARLTSIVAGKIKRNASPAMRIIAAILLAASIPGWAIEAKTKKESKPKQTPSIESTSSTKSTLPTEPRQFQIAQAESKTKPTNSRAERANKKIDEALKKPISIEFDNEYVQTILKFISGYLGINIVLDHIVVGEERQESPSEMDVVHIGPHWYRHPHLKHFGKSMDWPPSQVVDGMVGPFDGKAISAREVLDRLMPDSGMTYAVTPDCVWITVAEPQFEIHDTQHKPETWRWYPLNGQLFAGINQNVSKNLQAFYTTTGRRDSYDSVQIQIDREHISTAVEKIFKSFDSRTRDGKNVSAGLPPIIVDAQAIAPPTEGPIPKTYLIPTDKKRTIGLSRHWNKPASHALNIGEGQRRRAEAIFAGVGGKTNTPVTSGQVPFIKLDDVPLGDALTALLRPLNLTYLPGPDFIYITSPERSQNVDFVDSPVPADESKIRKALDEPASIEFNDQHVGTILEFVSEYMGVNIVVDSRAVIPENVENYSATGTNPVTDGHVPFIHVSDLRLADTLKALLTPLDLDYSIESGFIWVSSPEFIAKDSQTATIITAPAPKQRSARAESPQVKTRPMPKQRPRPQAKARPEAPVRAEAATVTRAKKPGPIVDGYQFRRITRWEDSDGRVEVEFSGGRVKWYKIGDTFQHIQIADIDVIANQVIIERKGELRVLQLTWPVQEGVTPKRRPKRAGRTASRWTWTPTPYGNAKFGPIARWENSDPRLQVEFPNGQRKWLEVGDAIGNARIGGINIIANQVIVRTPEGQTRTFDLPRPVQASSTTAPRAKRSTKQRPEPTWTPVDYGDVTIGRIARWEESRDEQVEIEFANGDRKWLEAGQSAGGITIVSIDILKNRVTVKRNGTTEVVQLP